MRCRSRGRGNGAVVLDDIEGRVEFDEVSFAYKDEDGSPAEQVLDDVSFTAEPGNYVGLVGPTGAGKSTTMRLLLRFYDPDERTVRLDGHDTADVDLTSLRRTVGFVRQEPYLFYGSVSENVAYGVPDVDAAEIQAAAKMAGAHEFVSNLPDGYETMVGERGVKLSGGQRQRVALARTILRDPDTILVMDEGEIVERGSHDELIASGGLYANLWNVQVGEMDELPEEFVQRSLTSSGQ